MVDPLFGIVVIDITVFSFSIKGHRQINTTVGISRNLSIHMYRQVRTGILTRMTHTLMLAMTLTEIYLKHFQ